MILLWIIIKCKNQKDLDLVRVWLWPELELLIFKQKQQNGECLKKSKKGFFCSLSGQKK